MVRDVHIMVRDGTHLDPSWYGWSEVAVVRDGLYSDQQVILSTIASVTPPGQRRGTEESRV
ncbi:hypothetical protein E2C01_028870 [Portunus trituberculatus]|uniref:Uncharacterized protein n=1 Tax=Portunus trituberculatus TaxID=210409 RepID=A0A5B7EQA2_PORTR|nr:hypothetical protein [Portunus trituberculatus]